MTTTTPVKTTPRYSYTAHEPHKHGLLLCHVSLLYRSQNAKCITTNNYATRTTRTDMSVTKFIEFLDKVTGCVDSEEKVDVVFLDFAKAFDKVPFK